MTTTNTSFQPVMGGKKTANLSASALLGTGEGVITGIFVASASASPTIKLWDNTSAAGTVLVNTFTPIAGSWYSLPFAFNTGLYITISGTLDCTVAYS